MKKRISRWLRELADKLDPHHEHAHITPGCMVNIHNASPFYPNVTVGSEALEDRPDALSKVHQAQYRAALPQLFGPGCFRSGAAVARAS